MEGGTTNAMDAIVTAITGMATTVQTNALSAISAVPPHQQQRPRQHPQR